MLARLLILLLAALVALPAATASARGSAGAEAWRTHRVADAHFSIALPASWRDLGRLSKSPSADPRVALYLETLRGTLGSLVPFIAVDADPRALSRFATNLNVIRQPTSLPLTTFTRTAAAQLEQNPAVKTRVRSRWVALPSGPALELTYRARFSKGRASWRIAATQYVLKLDGALFVLTYSTTPARARAYAPVFLRSARSLRAL